MNGILTTDGAGSNIFLNDVVHNNGGTNTLGHGFYIATQSNTISGCTSYSNGGRGIQVYSEGSTTNCNNNIISGNKCYNNGLSGRGPGISVASGTGIQVYNNICYGNRGGIQVDYWNLANTKVVNNTVEGNGSDFGIYIGTVASGTLVENNIVYNNTLVNDGDFDKPGHELGWRQPALRQARRRQLSTHGRQPGDQSGDRDQCPLDRFRWKFETARFWL